jgi:hypothetical protein
MIELRWVRRTSYAGGNPSDGTEWTKTESILQYKQEETVTRGSKVTTRGHDWRDVPTVVEEG